jgi:hypothetical protein
VFLRLNGIEPRADRPEWEELTLAVAASVIDREESGVGGPAAGAARLPG